MVRQSSLSTSTLHGIQHRCAPELQPQLRTSSLCHGLAALSKLVRGLIVLASESTLSGRVVRIVTNSLGEHGGVGQFLLRLGTLFVLLSGASRRIPLRLLLMLLVSIVFGF